MRFIRYRSCSNVFFPIFAVASSGKHKRAFYHRYKLLHGITGVYWCRPTMFFQDPVVHSSCAIARHPLLHHSLIKRYGHIAYITKVVILHFVQSILTGAFKRLNLPKALMEVAWQVPRHHWHHSHRHDALIAECWQQPKGNSTAVEGWRITYRRHNAMRIRLNHSKHPVPPPE